MRAIKEGGPTQRVRGRWRTDLDPHGGLDEVGLRIIGKGGGRYD